MKSFRLRIRRSGVITIIIIVVVIIIVIISYDIVALEICLLCAL